MARAGMGQAPGQALYAGAGACCARQAGVGAWRQFHFFGGLIVTLEARVMDLESRLAFQDDTIQALNDVLVAQQNAVDRLQMQMAALLKRQEEMGGQFESFEEEAPPPHY